MSRESLFLLCPLVGLSVLAWIVTAQHMGGAGSALVMGSMTMGLPFSVTNMLLYIALWGVMMVAMMFPAIVPVAGIFATMARQKQARQAREHAAALRFGRRFDKLEPVWNSSGIRIKSGRMSRSTASISQKHLRCSEIRLNTPLWTRITL